MKKYTLDKGTFGTPILEIDEPLFRKAVIAKRVIIEMLTAEEKYDAVVENFAEFERTIFDTTLENKIFDGYAEDWFNLARNKIERRFFNLISTCRSYLQYVEHAAKEIASASAINDLKEEKSRHYDESYAYRLMEGLRDQITYGGHAAHTITFSQTREDLSETDFVLSYVTPTLMVSYDRLVEDAKVKKKYLDEISQRGDKQDFVPMLREYIRRLSEIHDFFRNLCESKVKSSREFFDLIFVQFREAYPDVKDFSGLVARERDGKRVNKKFWIVPNSQRLDDFRKKNRVLRNLELSRVTNSIPEP